jgi:hypothetical protein
MEVRCAPIIPVPHISIACHRGFPMSKPRSSFLKKRALDEHAIEIRRLGRQTIENVIAIGEHLKECKRIVGHGGFAAWLKREFEWSQKTAENYMHLFELSKTPKFVTVTNLNLPLQSLYLLAPPGKEKARDAIVERAQRGEKVTSADIKAAVVGPKRQLPIARPAGDSGGEYTVIVPRTETTIRLYPPNPLPGGPARMLGSPTASEPPKVLTAADLPAAPSTTQREPLTGGDMLVTEAARFLKEYIALHVRGRGISEFVAVVEGMTEDQRHELGDALGIASDLISMLEQALDVANAAKRRGGLKLVSDNDGGSVH